MLNISGIIAPISAHSSEGAVGLGKQVEYEEAIVDATKERRRLDVEVEQTEEVKRRRTENASRETALETDLKQMNREFFCEICDKQYKTVTEVHPNLNTVNAPSSYFLINRWLHI